MRHASKPGQHGGASLVVVMVLLFSMALGVAYANRSLLFEQRTSINQYRATQAFEAAEAGLEWAQAMLNDPHAIGADCLASSSGDSLRERWLRFDAARLRHVPLTWNDAGRATSLHAACARTAASWSCACPAGGHPVLDPAAAAQASSAFIVHAEALDRPGMVRLVASGCTGVAGACAPAGTAAAEATSTVQAVLALVPGIASLPTAPLTARADVDAGSASIGLHNPEPASHGIAVHAGGRFVGTQARLATLPGTSPLHAAVAHDHALAGMPAERLFTAHFGLDKASWRSQPAVHRLACTGDCSAALAAALAGLRGRALVWVDGDLTLSGPLTLGTPAQPVIVVSTGAARFGGALTIHGVVHAASIAWNHASSGSALVRGALISEAGYSGDGAPDLFYDADVLRTLRHDSGSFVRLPGSWRDF